MAVYRIKKSTNFTAIDNRFIDDPRLSAKAKGILVYLVAKPPDWKVYENDIIGHMSDGRDAIRSGLKELRTAGYIMRRQARTVVNGKFDGYDYDVFEWSPLLDDSCISHNKWEEESFKRGERGNFDDLEARCGLQ